MIRAELDAAWAEWQQATLYRKWRQANPGEAARLDAYRASGGAEPSMATATGRALVKETKAWHLAAAPAPVDPITPTARPAFTPTRRIVCATRAEFDAAYENIQPRDLIDVRGVTFNGQLALHKRLTDWAEIHFDAACRLVGPTDRDQFHAAWVRASFLRIYGGDLTSSRGTGARFEDCENVMWWYGYIHDCLTGGLFTTVVSRDNVGLDLHFRVERGGMSTKYDNHAEVGTGVHACYIGGRFQAGYTTRLSKFRLDVSEQPYGAAVQVGEQMDESELWVRARDIRFNAQSQVAGNAIQLFGDLNSITIHHAEGTDLAGRVIEAERNNLYDTSSDIHVWDKVARNTNQNPRLDDNPFAQHPAITYH